MLRSIGTKNATGELTRDDIQAVADMRMTAMALVKLWEGMPARRASINNLHTITRECEQIIARGPPGLVHIIEGSATFDAIKHELTRSVFGDVRG